MYKFNIKYHKNKIKFEDLGFPAIKRLFYKNYRGDVHPIALP